MNVRTFARRGGGQAGGRRQQEDDPDRRAWKGLQQAGHQRQVSRALETVFAHQPELRGCADARLMRLAEGLGCEGLVESLDQFMSLTRPAHLDRCGRQTVSQHRLQPVCCQL